MKFDMIIGNPPYQKMTGGGGVIEGATPLYQEFVYKAIEMQTKCIIMLIPSKWMSGGSAVLDNFRKNLINYKCISKIYNFEKSKEIFDNIQLAGGIQYLVLTPNEECNVTEIHNCRLLDGKITEDVDIRDLSKYAYNNSNQKHQYMIVIDNKASGIVDKVVQVISDNYETFDSIVLPYGPYGIGTDFEDSEVETETKNIRVQRSNERSTWTSIDNVKQSIDTVEKWKVFTGCLNPDGGGTAKNDVWNVLNKPRILGPNEVCSMSYIIAYNCDSEIEASNVASYLRTKLARFLIRVTVLSIHITARNYMFLPILDFSKEWTDNELYSMFSLTDDEIKYIESKIRNWE